MFVYASTSIDNVCRCIYKHIYIHYLWMQMHIQTSFVLIVHQCIHYLWMYMHIQTSFVLIVHQCIHNLWMQMHIQTSFVLIGHQCIHYLWMEMHIQTSFVLIVHQFIHYLWMYITEDRRQKTSIFVDVYAYKHILSLQSINVYIIYGCRCIYKRLLSLQSINVYIIYGCIMNMHIQTSFVLIVHLCIHYLWMQMHMYKQLLSYSPSMYTLSMDVDAYTNIFCPNAINRTNILFSPRGAMGVGGQDPNPDQKAFRDGWIRIYYYC